jgi:hypothetical protein
VVWIAALLLGLVIGIVGSMWLVLSLGPTLRTLRRVDAWRADGAITVGVIAVVAGLLLTPAATAWVGEALDCEFNRKLHGSWRWYLDLIATGVVLPVAAGYLALTAWFQIVTPRELRPGVLSPFVEFFSGEEDAAGEVAEEILFGMIRRRLDELLLDTRLTDDELEALLEEVVGEEGELDAALVRRTTMLEVVEALQRQAGDAAAWTVPVGADEVGFRLEQVDRRLWRVECDRG